MIGPAEEWAGYNVQPVFGLLEALVPMAGMIATEFRIRPSAEERKEKMA
jgi:hypothetical protein